MIAGPQTGAVLRSSLVTSLIRYQRSWGLWLLLLIAPVGARFMISDESGKGIAIAVNDQLPVLTSPVLGVWLGIVVTTLLLPAGYIYLRANTNRRQPWQVEEVTAAPRVAMLMGRFLADAAVLLASLGTLTVAGWFLGWLMVTGPLAALVDRLCPVAGGGARFDRASGAAHPVRCGAMAARCAG